MWVFCGVMLTAVIGFMAGLAFGLAGVIISVPVGVALGWASAHKQIGTF
jgi:hypothetical protein